MNQQWTSPNMLSGREQSEAAPPQVLKYLLPRLESSLVLENLRGRAALAPPLPDCLFGEVHRWFIAVFTEETY